MIEAVSHLIHRDYEAIVQDFVTLDFIPPGTDLQPILPVLAKVWATRARGRIGFKGTVLKRSYKVLKTTERKVQQLNKLVVSWFYTA